MSRPKTVITPPAWFKHGGYASAESMDAADWYLNLKLRLRLLLGGLNATANNHLRTKFIRGGQPLVRRGLHAGLALFGTDFGPDVASILKGEEPRLGVYSLRIEELYAFERSFPEDVRSFARTFAGRHVHPRLIPPAFTGAVDHIFEPRMTGVFARIDLSYPDKVLLQHFREFVGMKRREFGRIGGRQPYRDALDELGSRRSVRLRTFFRLGVLPYMDLCSWAEEEKRRIPISAWADLLHLTSEDDVRETRRYAKLLLRPFVIDGWLIEQARAAVRKARE